MRPKNASNPEGLWNFAIGHPENFSWMNSSRFTIYLVTGTASISLVFNCFVIFRLIKDKFTVIGSSTKKISKQDIKLSIYAMCVFAADMIYCVQQYIRRSSNDEKFIDVMFDVQNAISDICCVIPIWFIILSNKSLRKNIVALFSKKDLIFISAVKPFNSKASAIAKNSFLPNPVSPGTPLK
uniref:7TM GPCR serpentine receptor class x (Srx) domain-containing protein n=1 Tax=Panagrolaimus davidi TaxID=227884 RepID=A0A914PJA0_9BILA